MPEEYIRYKVEIDDDDLTSKLAGIKSKISEALSSRSFSSAMYPAQQEAGGANAILDHMSNNVQSFVQAGTQATQLGYEKFTQDAKTTTLLAKPSYARESDTSFLDSIGKGIPPGILDKGYLSSKLGSATG